MLPEFAPKAWASGKNARSSFIPRTASPPGSSTSLQEERQARMPVLPRGPALRQHVPVWAESHPIREGCRAVAAYLDKTDVGNFHDGDIAFLVETRYGKSREPQNLLHFGQAVGDLDA